MFHFNGQPVSPAEAAAIIKDRRAEWHRSRLDRQRDRDTREGKLSHQLGAMIRGRA
jgi:hypothetical protein